MPDSTDAFETWLLRRVANATDLGWTGLFSFREMLRLGRHRQILALSGEEEALLATTRNAVVHVDHPLVSHYEGVQKLLQTRQLCQALIAELARVPEPLHGAGQALAAHPTLAH